MSSRLLLLLLVSASPLAAQGTFAVQRQQDSAITRLEHSRDSLLVLWHEARDLEAMQDSLEHAASVGRLDTVDVGAIRIITNASKLPLRAAAAAFWPVIDSLYGVEALRMREHPFVIQAVRPDSGRKAPARPREYWGVAVEDDTEIKGLVNILKANLTIGEPDSALRTWLPGQVIPPVYGAEVEASNAFVGMVTSPYTVSRNCFRGDIASCRFALRLEDRSSEALLSAYNAPERQQLALLQEGVFRQRRMLNGIVECRSGSDSACSELLRSLPPAQFPQPLMAESHQLLVHLTLRLGGREAFHRLLSDSASTLAHRLEYAAGIPLDSLIVRWRTAVIAARPEPVSLPLSGALVGLGWIALMGYFGLRSSRWRFG